LIYIFGHSSGFSSFCAVFSLFKNKNIHSFFSKLIFRTPLKYKVKYLIFKHFCKISGKYYKLNGEGKREKGKWIAENRMPNDRMTERLKHRITERKKHRMT